MPSPVIRVENLAKRYRLGLIGRTTLHEDLSRWWARVRGRPDPTLRFDQLQRLERRRQDAAAAGELPDDAEHVWALRDVSFKVQQGEVLGIIGRNGAGKSTLLKILTRVTAPTFGTVRMRGRVASLLEVGTGFHPELTGRENIFLNGAILGMHRAEIRRKFDEIVAFAEVEKFIDTPVKRYSSGMYVRLAFGVAAHLDPEILIVDEVLAVGDAEFQKKCLGKMGEVAQGGRTVLFVSHNMASVKRLCSRCILLHRGSLSCSGSPEDVIGEYLSGAVGGEALMTIPASAHRFVSDLQIAAIGVCDHQSRPSTLIRFGEDIVIRLAVRAARPFGAVRIGVGVAREGVRICTLHSPPTAFAGGPEPVWLTCRIPGGTLLPGVYGLRVGAHRADTGAGLDWIPDSLAFRVLSVSGEKGVEHDSRELGFVTIPSEWSSSTP